MHVLSTISGQTHIVYSDINAVTRCNNRSNVTADEFDGEIKIGYLYAAKSSANFLFATSNRQGKIISGAMTHAVTQINQDSNLLRGRQLRFIPADTEADTLKGTRSLTEMWRQGALAFFGPADSCEVEAKVAAAWNLPMISYVS